MDNRLQTQIDQTADDRQPPVFWDGNYPYWTTSAEDVCPVCNLTLQLRVNLVNGREIVDNERCENGHPIGNDEIPF